MKACGKIVMGIIFLGTINSVQAEPRVIYVFPSGSHQPPFTNWHMASTSIHDAVGAAVADDTVLVGNGVYKLTNQVVISENIIVRSVNGPKMTIVEGEGLEHAHRCFYVRAPRAVLDGFTITGGAVKGEDWDSAGGGVRVVAGTVQNCCIVSNTIVGDNRGYAGGASCSDSGLIKRCEIYGNSAVYGGGAVVNGRNAVIRECLIHDNISAGRSGGIEAGGKALVLDCVVVSNRAGAGGGFYEYDGVFRESIFYYNQPDNWRASAISGTLVHVCTTPMHSGSNDINNLIEEPRPDELQIGGVIKMLRRKIAAMAGYLNERSARLQEGLRLDRYREESKKLLDEWEPVVKTAANPQSTDEDVRLAMRARSDLLLKRTHLLYYKISMELLFGTE